MLPFTWRILDRWRKGLSTESIWDEKGMGLIPWTSSSQKCFSSNMGRNLLFLLGILHVSLGILSFCYFYCGVILQSSVGLANKVGVEKLKAGAGLKHKNRDAKVVLQ